MSTYSSVWRPTVSYDIPNRPSIAGACDGPTPRVNPGRPIVQAAAATRLNCSAGWTV